MATPSINNPSALLQAQNAYNNTNTQKVSLPNPQVDIKSAESFHNMVNKNFNSFAKMSAENIIAFAKQVHNNGIIKEGMPNPGTITKMIAEVAGAVKKDEEVKKRSIVNEASVTEVIAATSEAKTALQTAVAVRNKVHEAFNKIMDMPL